ncbi:19046_t:CDS:2 [Gigaspora margarita]|uniref:19046_t:CDS:1 n=1 Tax=Gigaspora margarita TaxID=4874 RepID=A0ABN7VYA3_GIGMA|nr:19046_t:CDS:2 [Gigaspora margarita]
MLSKKLKALEKNNELHSYVEFSSAMQKRRKEIIKVCTTLQLKAEIEERYKVYKSCSFFNTYLWPQHINSLSAKQHYHSIAIQDDKAKVLLGITAVGRTFKTIQSDNDPVIVPDHDFFKEQSAYNLVERSMSTLSEKLARIVLLVDHFGSHLDAQRDDIHGKKVFVNYIDHKTDSFDETFKALLSENDRFLPPFTKDRDDNCLPPLPYVYVKTILDLSISDG